MPNSGMKKLLLSLSTERVDAGQAEPVRDALRCGLNQETPSCHSVVEERHRAGVGRAAERLLRDGHADAPPMPMDFMP